MECSSCVSDVSANMTKCVNLDTMSMYFGTEMNN